MWRQADHAQPDGSREHLYSAELADEICRRIANGETLYEVCEDPAIPVSASAVRQWDLDDRDGFSAKYASAKRQLIEAWSDQLVQIADNDLLEPNDRRVRIDTRKWLMSKLHPARYGDKVTLAGDAKSPLQHVVRALDLTKLSGPELDAFIATCQPYAIAYGCTASSISKATRSANACVPRSGISPRHRRRLRPTASSRPAARSA